MPILPEHGDAEIVLVLPRGQQRLKIFELFDKREWHTALLEDGGEIPAYTVGVGTHGGEAASLPEGSEEPAGPCPYVYRDGRKKCILKNNHKHVGDSDQVRHHLVKKSKGERQLVREELGETVDGFGNPPSYYEELEAGNGNG